MRDSGQDMDTCHRVFHLFARSSDGIVEIEHLPLMVRQAGHDITEAAARELASALPRNTCTLEEFSALCDKAREHAISRDRLLEAFRTFDQDGSGLLSTKTLKAILQKSGEPMTSEEIENCISKMNPDPDGKIDYEAFVKGKALRD